MRMQYIWTDNLLTSSTKKCLFVEDPPLESHTCHQYLPTAYVVRREGYVLTRVCPSVCPHLVGVPRPGPDGGGGVPQPGLGGYPSQVQARGGVPQPGLTGGAPARGYPTSGTLLPLDWGGGGTPPQVTDGVLDMPRSVCLLPSRRRIFFLTSLVRDPMLENVREFNFLSRG